MTEYTWDHRNRLTRITKLDALGGNVLETVDYGYDAFNRRISKAMDSDGDGAVDERSYIIHDGLRSDRDNAGDHRVLELDATGQVTGRYLFGPAVDQVLADEQIDVGSGTTNILWPLSDNLGSIRAVADYDPQTSTTTVVNKIDYDSFGNVVNETNAAVDHIFGFTGRERDDESDLYYYRARYYDPSLGRFISEDPIGFDAGDSNLRRYVGNDPVSGLDPSGLDEPDESHRGSSNYFEFPSSRPGIPFGYVPYTNPLTGAESCIGRLRKLRPAASRPPEFEDDIRKFRLDPEHLPWDATRRLVERHREAGTLLEQSHLIHRRPLLGYVVPLRLSDEKMKKIVIQLDVGSWFQKPHYRLLAILPDSYDSNSALEAYLFGPAERKGNKACLGVMEFTLHAIPGGAAVDYISQGDYREAGIAVAGDVTMLLTGGGSKALAATAKGQRALRATGTGIEVSIATYRASQGVSKLSNGDGGYGELGEALLRAFFSVRILRAKGKDALASRGTVDTSGVVTGLRNRGAFQGMTLTGETRSGLSRTSAAWRARYGPAAMRGHHLVPQEMLQNPLFMQRMRALGYTDDEIVTFVNRQISDLPNVQHMQIHAEGWNDVWRVWLQRNQNFTVSDMRAQMRAMMQDFELPRGSLGGPQYGRR